MPSILPNSVIDGPDDVEERVESMCASLRRFARFEPDCVLCLTGAAGEREEVEARELVVDGLRRLAATADSAGVRLGLEPIHASQRDGLTLVTTIPETLSCSRRPACRTSGSWSTSGTSGTPRRSTAT